MVNLIPPLFLQETLKKYNPFVKVLSQKCSGEDIACAEEKKKVDSLRKEEKKKDRRATH